MIAFRNVTHGFRSPRGRQQVLDSFSGEVPAGRYVTLATHPALRTEIMRLCGGSVRPQSGRIERDGAVSWPIGQIAPFRSYMTGAATLGFFCSMYQIDTTDARHLVREMAGIDEQLQLPTIKWPSSMLSKFALTLALIPRFSIYLVDGSILHPDLDFQDRWLHHFEQRIDEATLIMATTQKAAVRRYCNAALIGFKGQLLLSENVDAAIEYFTLSPTDELVGRENPDETADDDI